MNVKKTVKAFLKEWCSSNIDITKEILWNKKFDKIYKTHFGFERDLKINEATDLEDLEKELSNMTAAKDGWEYCGEEFEDRVPYYTDRIDRIKARIKELTSSVYITTSSVYKDLLTEYTNLQIRSEFWRKAYVDQSDSLKSLSTTFETAYKNCLSNISKLLKKEETRLEWLDTEKTREDESK